MNSLEHLGQAMTDAGNEFGPTGPYGGTLLKVSRTQFKLGLAEREFVQTCAINVLGPLKRFLDGDMRTIGKEKKVLMNKRLDLDSAKTRLKKARELEANPNAKKTISVEQADADVRIAQSEFDKQAEILKLLLQGIESAHVNHLRYLRDFAEAQMTFYAQAHQHMADLQRDLSNTSEFNVSGFSASASPARLTPMTSGAPIASNGLSGGMLDTADMGTKRARTLFDYDAINPNELSVKKDDVLIVYRLPGLDPEFVMAEKGNLRGRVPLSYLEIVS